MLVQWRSWRDSLPIGEFIDHGANVQPDPVIDAFLQHTYPQLYRTSRHTVVKPGTPFRLRVSTCGC